MKDAETSVAAVAEALRRYLRGARVPLAAPAAEPPTNSDEIRAGMLQSVISAAVDAYKENARITAVLDDKAQKVAQNAGLFLAAGFALMKPGTDNVSNYIGIVGLMTMACAVALLMMTIVLCLVANWLRRIPAPLNPQR